MGRAMTPEEIAEQLRKDPIYDPATQLRAGGREELETALSRWQAEGLRAYVVLVPDADARALRDVWGVLGLDAGSDLLLVWTETRWEARGWGLDDAVVARELDAAEGELGQYLGRGLVSAVDRLGAASTGEPAESPSWASAAAIGGAGVLGVLLAGGLGLVLRRRNQRAREAVEFGRARAEVEHALAELLLTADDLGREEARKLQSEGARLSDELRRIERGDEPPEVREGRVRQVGNEVAALQTTVLQSQQRKETS
jgi:hypothetical protein